MAYDDENEPEVNLDAIEKEILDHGLQNERKRLEEALFNLEYYHGNFERFPVRKVGQNSDGSRFERTSLFMKKAVKSLTAFLYKEGPKRTLGDHEEATAWLDHVYRKNNIDAVWQEADRFSFISDVACIQVEPCKDPDCPVRIRVWDASTFVVWCDPDEPAKPIAVGTIDRYDNSRRLRVWTATEIREYRTRKYTELTLTSGATAFQRYPAGNVKNKLGFLPFTYVWCDYPIADFWSVGGYGCHLRECNDWINKRLTDLFDSCRYNLNPILLLKFVRAGWRPDSPLAPGMVINPPPDLDAAGDSNGSPDAEYLQADPAFVMAGWEDLDHGIDHTLEMADVPPALMRMTSASARSGVSIISEQIEPVKFAEARQRLFQCYEDDLAILTLKVGAKHLGSPKNIEKDTGYKVTAAQLEAAAAKPELRLHWPSLWPRIPGTDADTADQAELDMGIVSRTKLIERRQKFNNAEATAYIEEVAEQLKAEQELLSAAMPKDPDSEDEADSEDKGKAGEPDKELADETDDETGDDEVDE